MLLVLGVVVATIVLRAYILPTLIELELFSIAKTSIRIDGDVPRPNVEYVSNDYLRSKWIEINKPIYEEWVKEVGKEEADNIQNFLVDSDIIGGFYPLEPRVIYVDESLETCKKRSVIIHEMIHYLQNYNDGKFDGLCNPSEDLIFSAEKKAESVEKAYYEKCVQHE
jgi:hypothetical protein